MFFCLGQSRGVAGSIGLDEVGVPVQQLKVFWITAGSIATHVVDLVAFRYLFQIVVGAVDEPVEHLWDDRPVLHLPVLAEVSIKVGFMGDAHKASRIELLKTEPHSWAAHQ